MEDRHHFHKLILKKKIITSFSPSTCAIVQGKLFCLVNHFFSPSPQGGWQRLCGLSLARIFPPPRARAEGRGLDFKTSYWSFNVKSRDIVMGRNNHELADFLALSY